LVYRLPSPTGPWEKSLLPGNSAVSQAQRAAHVPLPLAVENSHLEH
jgi:hypothetical protein